MAHFRRFLLIFGAIAATTASLVGCSEAPQEPPRILAPSIRTTDLIEWVRESGIELSAEDWVAIDRAHDEYLAQVLPERVGARDRITQHYRPVDDHQELTPHERWTLAKSSAAIARDFERSLATYDDRFLRGLASERRVATEFAEYFVVRRRLDRLAQRFGLAQPKLPLISVLPRPVEWTLESWPTGEPRSVDAITEWVVTSGARLIPLGERLWEQVVRGSLTQLEPSPPSADGTPTPSAEDDDMVRFQASMEAAVGPAQEFLRASLDVVDPPALIEAQMVPKQARVRAAERVLDSIQLPDAMRAVEVSSKAALALPNLSAEMRIRVEAERDLWRADLLARLRGGDRGMGVGLEAARSAMARLLALFPDPEVRAAIESPPKGPQVEVSEAATDDDTDGVIPDSARHYANWAGVALVPRPPSRHELRELARLSGLDAEQARLFVDDSLQEWAQFMDAQSVVVSETEAAIGAAMQTKGEAALDQPSVVASLLAKVVSECIERPVHTAAAVDAHIADSLRVRVQSLGGSAEAALAIWNALRALPEPTRAWAQAGHSELRCFGAVALGSVAALALDEDLPVSSRRVLADLVVEQQNPLLETASVARAAQVDAVRALARIMVKERESPFRAQASVAPVIAQLFAAASPSTDLNDSIIEKACALLPADDALALRHARAMKQYPELLADGSTPFARDGARARSLAAGARGGNDGALERELRRADLALVETVMADIRATPGAQPTRAGLNRLAAEREALAEQSLRRVDHAARAAR